MFVIRKTTPNLIGAFIRAHRRALDLSTAQFDRLYEFEYGIAHIETTNRPITLDVANALIGIMGDEIRPLIKSHNHAILELRYLI